MNPAETVIDHLLIFMNSEIEAQGVPIQSMFFDFEPGKSDYNDFYHRYSYETQQIIQAIKSSISRGYIEKMTLGGDHLDSLTLTTRGQARAMSVTLEKENERPQNASAATIVINTLNSHGNTQVGNGNIINIGALSKELLDKLQSINAPENEKEEARDIISRFFEHPLVCSILGGIVGGLPK